VNDTTLANYIGAWGADVADHDVWAEPLDTKVPATIF
jgi:hypothetical protein